MKEGRKEGSIKEGGKYEGTKEVSKEGRKYEGRREGSMKEGRKEV